MRLAHLTAIGLCVVVGSCAAAVPGSSPPDRFDKYRAMAPRGGGFDAAGSYALSEQEQKLNCKQLTGSIAIKIIQMREAGSRVRPSSLAAFAQGATRPTAAGPGYGADIETDLRNDRARLEALNRQLAAKSCPAFDLEAELRPGNTTPPRPVKASGNKA
jgi:hypothetical protein